MPSDDKEIEVTVTGKVQGVNFRNFVKEHADELDVTGTVRNMPDGSVEVVAQGDEASLRALLEYLQEGPYFARVDDLEVQWHDMPRDTFTAFSVVR